MVDTLTADEMVTVVIPRWFAERMRLNAARKLRIQKVNAKHAKGLGRMKLHAQFAAGLTRWESVFAQIDSALSTHQAAPESALETTA